MPHTRLRRENEPFAPGVAFPLVDKLLALNSPEMRHAGVEVILVSRNSADTGLRIFNSIEHYGLDIERAAFTSGESREEYLRAYGADLFLSTPPRGPSAEPLIPGLRPALILPGAATRQSSGQLRIAFDGDAVLFGDEAERIYQESGLDAFAASESARAEDPLPGGPFKPVLEANPRYPGSVSTRPKPGSNRPGDGTVGACHTSGSSSH